MSQITDQTDLLAAIEKRASDIARMAAHRPGTGIERALLIASIIVKTNELQARVAQLQMPELAK